MNDRNTNDRRTIASAARPVAAEVMPRAALTVMTGPSIVAPSKEEMEEGSLAVAEKLGALAALLTDPGLPEATRVKVQGLLALAAPVKPGMEEVSTTWSVVRIQMAQPTTQASAKPESARPGDLYTTAGALLDKPFAFIPLYFSHENIMFREGEKAPECVAPDAKLGQPYGLCKTCPQLPFGQQNGGHGEQEKTHCQNQIVVAALAADLSQIYLITFAKTSRKIGAALVKLAKAQPFPWKQSYLLTTEKKTGDLGAFYVFKIEPTGKDNPPDVIQLAERLSELYGVNRKKVLGEWYARAAAPPSAVAVAGDGGVHAARAEKAIGKAPVNSMPSTPKRTGASSM